MIEKPFYTRFVISYDLILFILINIGLISALWPIEVSILSIVFLFISELFLFLLFGNTSYYFILHPRKLEIKSKWYFWFKKCFNLDEISEIRIEHVFRVGIALILINSMDRKHIYPFSQISKVDVKELCARLEAFGVKIEYRTKLLENI